MNYRRGFFRVWMVLSLLWAISMGVMFYPDVKREFDKVNAAWGKQDEMIVPVLCKDARGVEGKDYSSSGPWNNYRPEKLCSYELPNFRRLFTEYRDISDDALYDRLLSLSGQSPRVKPDPWGQLWAALGVSLGLPLLVLAVGGALAWALSGFRR